MTIVDRFWFTHKKLFLMTTEVFVGFRHVKLSYVTKILSGGDLQFCFWKGSISDPFFHTKLHVSIKVYTSEDKFIH